MAAAAAAFVSAAVRRFSSSASTITMREVRGSHKFTIDGCKASRKLPSPIRCCSKNFEVAGCSWRISCDPNGKDGNYISLFLDHQNPGEECGAAAAEFKFTLLDPAGNPVPKYSTSSPGVCGFHGSSSRSQGCFNFIRWKDLEDSGCLIGDRFSVRCDITAIMRSVHDDDDDDDNDTTGCAAASPAAAQVVAVPPSNLREHLGNLLSMNQGTDVTIDAGGQSWDLHSWLLAVRCPVLYAELEAAPERICGGTFCRRMEIEGMERKVFEAMLHFLYTDALPEIGEQEAVVPMAQGLIAAAHRYELERLKLMCEEILCSRVDMDTVAGSLAVAEKHGCRALKAACVELLCRPGNLKAVVATEGYEKVKADCAGVVLELIMKQLP
ncbi:unnamed protein product [Urochloa humidicola]